MFERFTERARQVVVLAQQEARDFQHNYIGTEHVLLALMAEEEGLAARVLEQNGLQLEKSREYLKQWSGVGTEPLPPQIPFTPRGKKLFEMALREALSLGHNYIGTEHILLAVARLDEGIAYKILRKFDINPEDIRNDVIAVLSGPSGRKQQKVEQGEVRDLQAKVEQLRKQLEETRQREREKLWVPAKERAKIEEESLSEDGLNGWEQHLVKAPAIFTYGDLTLKIADVTSGRVSIQIKRPSGSLLGIS